MMPALQKFSIPLTLSAIALVLALTDEAGQQLLRYDRAAILQGAWWRLLSGHLLHLGWSHLLMNLAGLALVWALVGGTLSNRNWLIILSADALITGLGLLIFNPQLDWYVGLSGILHGLLVAGIITQLKQGQRGSVLLLAALALKLAWEQFAGPLPGSESSAGGRVIVDAHLYGALGGLLALLLPTQANATTGGHKD